MEKQTGKALVLTSEGKWFCNGLDLTRMATSESAGDRAKEHAGRCKTLSTSTFRERNKLLVKNKIQNYMEDIAARFTVHMAGTF